MCMMETSVSTRGFTEPYNTEGKERKERRDRSCCCRRRRPSFPLSFLRPPAHRHAQHAGIYSSTQNCKGKRRRSRRGRELLLCSSSSEARRGVCPAQKHVFLLFLHPAGERTKEPSSDRRNRLPKSTIVSLFQSWIMLAILMDDFSFREPPCCQSSLKQAGMALLLPLPSILRCRHVAKAEA